MIRSRPRHRSLLAAAALAAAVACILLVVSASARSAPRPVVVSSAASKAYFDPTDRGTRLDLFGARFGQSANSDLNLVLRTHQPFTAQDVMPAPTRALCVWLRSHAASAPEGRLCVTPDARAKSGVGLRYTTLDHAGQRLGIRDLPVVVRRPRDTMISASFSPGLLRLAQGRYHWQARSQDGSVEDRLPSGGEATLDVVISNEPAARLRCFGAASRDPYRRCVNRKLRRAIVPPPEDAVFVQNSPCTPLPVEGEVKPCEFGVPSADARATMALIGDSHASHWRAALEVVAQRKQWRGVSMTRSGCPLMRARTRLQPPERRASCAAWTDDVPKWFAAHPNVEIAFVVAHFAGDVFVPKGSSERETKIAGFIAAWKSLPASVKHIIVIRDTPIIGYNANECVLRAKKDDRNAGDVCAVRRGDALRKDPAVLAAKRLNSPRVKVIDMTRFLCSRKRCFPVIGGALVYKDDQHITDVFATTLGPYLLGAVNRAL